MKKAKPAYTSLEILDLRTILTKDYNSDIITELDRFIEQNPDEETKKLMARDGVIFTDDTRVFEAYEDIASEASSLEFQAKELRRIVKAFRCLPEELPTLINDQNKTVATVATWRLSLGR